MDSYLSLLSHVYDNGRHHDDRTNTGTYSVFGAQWEHDMRDGFPLLTTKKLPPKHIFWELMWILRGLTNVEYLQKRGVTIWDEWATEEKCSKWGLPPGELGHTYGGVLRNFYDLHYEDEGDLELSFRKLNALHPGNDQLRTLLTDLEESPYSRRLMVSLWNPITSRNIELPPCHYGFQLKCQKDNSLDMRVTMRSCDIFLGLPFNIASYAFLLTMICKVTSRTPGKLVFQFGDLHLYKNHTEQALRQMERTPKFRPSVMLYSSAVDNPLECLLAFTWDHVVLEDYCPHPVIKAPVAV